MRLMPGISAEKWDRESRENGILKKPGKGSPVTGTP